jgi:hypothetical protein
MTTFTVRRAKGAVQAHVLLLPVTVLLGNWQSCSNALAIGPDALPFFPWIQSPVPISQSVARAEQLFPLALNIAPNWLLLRTLGPGTFWKGYHK